MKKILFLVGLFCLTLNISGQNKKIEFGIKGGLNYANFVDKNDDDIPADYKGKVGFFIGGIIEFSINEKIAVKPEFIYSLQGSNFTINGADLNIFSPNPIFITEINGKIKESLLILPIMVNYKLNREFLLEFGPQFGYLLNREVEYDNNPLDIGGFLRNDDTEKIELGIGLGIGYSLSNDFGISLRYNYGIIERQNLNTSVIQFGISYKL